MNKVILMGRITKDPEVRYTQGEKPMAVARYTLAVARKFKRQGEPSADFLNCVAFGKVGDFAEKYFRKGQMVAVVGHIQNRNWEDKDGRKHYATDIIVDEQYFSENKSSSAARSSEKPATDGFYPLDELEDDCDLPFR